MYEAVRNTPKPKNHALRTLFINLLVHIDQKVKLALEISVKIAVVNWSL